MRKTTMLKELQKMDKATLESMLTLARVLNGGLVIDNALIQSKDVKSEDKKSKDTEGVELPKGKFYTAYLKGLDKGYDPHFQSAKKCAVNDYGAYYNKTDRTFEFASSAKRKQFVDAQKKYDNEFKLATVTR